MMTAYHIEFYDREGIWQLDVVWAETADDAVQNFLKSCPDVRIESVSKVLRKYSPNYYRIVYEGVNE